MINLDERILLSVEKPARYTGGEVNAVIKDPEKVDIRYAMCFPDVYEVGMSHLGIRILYHVINERADAYCERAYAPWVDMEKVMKEENIPLYSLETKTPLNQFDIVGFTLQYEMSYTNILNMLSLSRIPLRYSERSEDDPFIMMGGPCAYNPEPLWEIADVFVMGEGEEVTDEILDVYADWKKKGLKRKDFLQMVSKVDGVYVPSFYEVLYNEDGTIRERKRLNSDCPEIIKKRIINDLNKCYYPEKVIVPLTDIVHDRIVLETFRGCTRGCRFCQAGMIYRPVREKTTDTLLKYADALIKNTGYDEISLTSLSICDYSDVERLIHTLMERYSSKKVGVSLPSLRIDSFSVGLINEIQRVRKTGLTFAPEAGSQRMRDVINKGVTEDDLVKSVTDAFSSGWSTIKLYFMIGLPLEQDEDVLGISDLGQKVVDCYYSVPKEKRKKGLSITLSTSSFVPKPFTPFQWVSMNRIEELRRKQVMLKGHIRSKAISYNYHEAYTSFLEGVFARGDRRLSEVLIKAFEKGCRFDGWQEFFNFEKWMEAFKECNVDPEFYAYRERSFDEILPWDFLELGVSKEYLISEYKKANKEQVTKDCRLGCTNCGVNQKLEGCVCFNGAISR